MLNTLSQQLPAFVSFSSPSSLLAFALPFFLASDFSAVFLLSFDAVPFFAMAIEFAIEM